MEELVTIKTFTYPLEVVVLRARLESEGIPCFTKNEIITQVHPFSSNAYGGIKLQVRESDLRKALEILDENEYPDIEIPEKQDVTGDLICPVCGSNDVSEPKKAAKTFRWLRWLFIPLAKAIAPAIENKCHCFNCGLDFEAKRVT